VTLIQILLILVPSLPLASAVATALLGKKVLGQRSHLPVVAAIGLSCVAAVVLAFLVRTKAAEASQRPGQAGYEQVVALWTWADVKGTYAYQDPGTPRAVQTRDFQIAVVLRVDPLTAIMLAMVTFVSLLVAVYAAGYMHGDPGYWRFFSYIGLFVFSMTMLVSVSNFVLLYVFWEAVGVCSYLLIGFWFEKPEAAAAGKKAFLVNRIGDFGFALGVFLIWTTFGSLNFHDVKIVSDSGRVVHDTRIVCDDQVEGTIQEGVLGQHRLARPDSYPTGPAATAICLLLFLGACGKSAQFPLHVWLPDAMEGPTPVSALIHAATMVTAGIYMVTRCTPLFAASGEAQLVVAVIGGFTALLAALVALTQTDLKRILAYSTISQLGYMFLGLGAGTLAGITAGMFHLFTHAFFKALLFLGAGSVMHAMGGVIDIRRFGGLRRLMPVTHWTFLVGCLALAGVVPFAGFWSKDAILAAIHDRGGPGAGAETVYHWLYLAAVFTAMLTAFYTFRAFFRTFYGEERIPPEAGSHAHESPNTMTVPLIVLAICAFFVGWYFEWTHGFANFLEQTPSLAAFGEASAGHAPAAAGHQAAANSHLAVMITSTLVALAGIAIAALFYLPGRRLVELLTRLMTAAGLYQLSRDKFYFDEIYQTLVIGPIELLSRCCYWVDDHLLDGLVNLVGRLPPGVAARLKCLQSGLTQFYALAMVLGMLVLVVAMLMGWGVLPS
jgi:NADH-quinone oxidoreductase subunit L